MQEFGASSTPIEMVCERPPAASGG